jgi:hypothetical protein
LERERHFGTTRNEQLSWMMVPVDRTTDDADRLISRDAPQRPVANRLILRTIEASTSPAFCCGSTGGSSSLLRAFRPAIAVFHIPFADEVVAKFGVARVAR